MRILALMTFDMFARSLGEALEKLGHEVHYLREFDERELQQAIAVSKPDMVIDMGWDVWHMKHKENGTFEKIGEILRRSGIFHLYFAEEDWLHFDRWSKRYCLAMKPDFVFTRSERCVAEYRRMGFPAAFFDVGCNPELHKPYPPDPAYVCDVALAATGNFNWGEIRYKSIYDLVTPLIDAPFDTRIWGDHWSTLSIFYPGKSLPERMIKGKLDFEKTPHLYSSAKICLSVQTCKDQLSSRTLDIMAAGGFLLTSDTAAVRDHLSPGVCCETTGSPEETLEKIRYYLKNEDARRKIAANGRKLAVERYAYQRKIQAVWPEVERRFDLFRRRVTTNAVTPKRKAPQDINRVVNGTFQADGLEPWYAHNAVKHGARVGGLSCVEFSGGSENAFIHQYVPVEPGKTYEFQGSFARLGKGKPSFISIMIQYFAADDSFLTSALQSITFCDQDNGLEWLRLNAVTITAPAQAAKALVVVNKMPEENSAPVLATSFVFAETELIQ